MRKLQAGSKLDEAVKSEAWKTGANKGLGDKKSRTQGEHGHENQTMRWQMTERNRAKVCRRSCGETQALWLNSMRLKHSKAMAWVLVIQA